MCCFDKNEIDQLIYNVDEKMWFEGRTAYLLVYYFTAS